MAMATDRPADDLFLGKRTAVARFIGFTRPSSLGQDPIGSTPSAERRDGENRYATRVPPVRVL